MPRLLGAGHDNIGSIHFVIVALQVSLCNCVSYLYEWRQQSNFARWPTRWGDLLGNIYIVASVIFVTKIKTRTRIIGRRFQRTRTRII